MPKNLLGRIIKRFRNFRAWKIFLQKKEISIFSVATFFSHSAENYSEGNHSMFQNSSGMEKFYAEEGDITIFCWKFFSHNSEKFREVNHSTFQKYSGIEKFYA